jgi:hypothetical protein
MSIKEARKKLSTKLTKYKEQRIKLLQMKKKEGKLLKLQLQKRKRLEGRKTRKRKKKKRKKINPNLQVRKILTSSSLVSLDKFYKKKYRDHLYLALLNSLVYQQPRNSHLSSMKKQGYMYNRLCRKLLICLRTYVFMVSMLQSSKEP